MNESVFDHFPVLSTPRLLLRAPLPSDASAIFSSFTDERTLRFIGKHPFSSIAEAGELVQRWITAWENKEGIRWVLTTPGTGAYMGSGGFWRIIRPHFRAEIGYDMHPDYCTQGYMTEAIAAMCAFAFSQMQLHSIEANIHPDNRGSASVLEKNGFVQEGYFKEHYFFNGSFSDTATYSKINPAPHSN